jgi:hypothetical protein
MNQVVAVMLNTAKCDDLLVICLSSYELILKCKFFVANDYVISCSNRVNRHFHCIRPGCGYSFVRYSTMAIHEQKHRTGGTGGGMEEANEAIPETSGSHRRSCESPMSTGSQSQKKEPGERICFPFSTQELN